MKTIYTLLLFIMCALSLSAQHLLPTERPDSKFKIKNFSIALGTEMDMLYGLSQEQLVSMIRGPQRYAYETLEFTAKDIESMTCENPTISIAMGVQPKGFKNGYFELSARAIWDRLDHVGYRKNVFLNGQQYESYIAFDSKSNEANLGLAYIHQLRAFNTFGLRLGLGTNIGYSFGNTMSVSGSNVKINALEIEPTDQPFEQVIYEQFSDSYEMRNSLYNRAYLEAGVDLTLLNKVTLGLVYQYGYGIRTTFGNGEIDPIKNQSIRLFATYQL